VTEHERRTRRLSLAEVQRHRDEIYGIAAKYGVRNVRVFGSVARGEATAASDLDLLVDIDRGRGYLAATGFAMDVEDLMGVFTQVATEKSLRPRIRREVLSEAVDL
jgi:predicted nucleotidyltransferase